MKCISPSNYTTPPAYEVAGSTMTIPGLAPTLLELIQASICGESLPLTSPPKFDDSDDSGMARVSVASSSASEVYEFAESALTEQSTPPTPPTPPKQGEEGAEE